MTSDARIICSIESNLKANERVPGANFPWERHSRSTGACPVLWKMEIQKVLGVFELPQDEQETDDVLVASEWNPPHLRSRCAAFIPVSHSPLIDCSI